MQKFIISISLICSAIQITAMEKSFEFKPTAVRAPLSLGNVKLIRNENGFYVMNKDDSTHIHNYNIDPLLKKASKKMLKKFQKAGYVEIKRQGDEFILKTKIRGLGGGPILAGILYGVTKTIGNSVTQALGEDICEGVVAVATQHITGSVPVTVAVVVTPGVTAAITTACIEVTALGMGFIGAIIPTV